jgi:poly(hydroxyalkanoate) depolymerase family esterase
MPITLFDRSVARTNKRVTVTVPPLADNPGNISGQIYWPGGVATGNPLVVVLHGCTQNGVAYAEAAGWLALADRHSFTVLIPQQQRSNNPNLCFNWFDRGDIVRGGGEVASIKAMIDWTLTNYGIDPSRVYITGLSAGAAMAGAMLATYPEIFAGGGLIAGLPYGTADSVQTAFQQMRAATRETGSQLAARVTTASPHKGVWPKVSVWHGEADRTVAAANGIATIDQWLAVHGLQNVAPDSVHAPSFQWKIWRDHQGRALVEHITVPELGHGTPIDTRALNAVGTPAPYVLDVGIASSVHLLDFWEFAPAAEFAIEGTVAGPLPVLVTTEIFEPVAGGPTSVSWPIESGVAKIINDALRAGGLLK